MPVYKLIYFDLRARGETTRMLFHMAGQKFEDVRIKREDWKDLKQSSVFGQMPMLEVDGVRLCQSHAIERLVAKRFGFYGKTDMDQAKADMIVDCVEDMRKPIREINRAKESEKETLKAVFLKDQLPMWLDKLEQMVNEHGFFIDERVMWPDVFYFNVLQFAQVLVDTTAHMEKVPKLKALMDAVAAEPHIAAWLSVRPDASH